MNVRLSDAVLSSLRLVTLLHKLFEASWALQHTSDTALHKIFRCSHLGLSLSLKGHFANGGLAFLLASPWNDEGDRLDFPCLVL